MQWFYNLKIASKMLLATMLTLTAICAIGLLSLYQAMRLQDAHAKLTDKLMPAKEVFLRLDNIANQVSHAQQALLRHQDTSVQESRNALAQDVQAFHATLQGLSGLALDKDQNDSFTTLADTFAAFQQENNVLLQDGAPPVTAKDQDHPAVIAFNVLHTMIRDFLTQNTQQMQTAQAQANAIYALTQTLILAFLGASILLGLITSLWLARLISRQMKEAVIVAERVAAGDLTGDIAVMSKDESGQLLFSLKTMSDALRKLVSQIHVGAKLIHHAASDMSADNTDLSARTQNQVNSLQTTSTAIASLAATVRQNADNAAQANNLAIKASEVAINGGNVMEQVVSTMGSINTASRRIVDIISVIDGIAFQTNILALNAAVEAARAGEQGRGFAVVASEVRSLAQRSASAAREIKALIDNSVEEVGTGSKLVEQAGATMQDIVTSIKHVTDIVSEIASATAEQRQEIDEVNRAVTQMEQSTQQNVTLVEQSTATTQAMEQQAGKLFKAVDQFSVDDGIKVARERIYTALQQQGTRQKATTKPLPVPSAKPAVSAMTTTKVPTPASVTPKKVTTDDEGDWTQF